MLSWIQTLYPQQHLDPTLLVGINCGLRQDDVHHFFLHFLVFWVLILLEVVMLPPGYPGGVWCAVSDCTCPAFRRGTTKGSALLHLRLCLVSDALKRLFSRSPQVSLEGTRERCFLHRHGAGAAPPG